MADDFPENHRDFAQLVPSKGTAHFPWSKDFDIFLVDDETNPGAYHHFFFTHCGSRGISIEQRWGPLVETRYEKESSSSRRSKSEYFVDRESTARGIFSELIRQKLEEGYIYRSYYCYTTEIKEESQVIPSPLDELRDLIF